MLINIETIIAKYGTPTGIIHVGGHYLEERADYQRMGLFNTVWVDANDDIVAELLSKTTLSEGEKIFHCLVSDIDNQEMKFYVTNNLCSSSMLKLETHQNHYPHIKVIQVKEYKTKRLDTLFTENSVSFTDRNFMNLDIQGAELLALKGCGKILDSIKYIYAEINVEHLYENCCLVGEMDDYLKVFGFNRVETAMTSQKWGDALYIRWNMPKRKVYTISQITDAFYAGASAEKIKKMVETLAPKKKTPAKRSAK